MTTLSPLAPGRRVRFLLAALLSLFALAISTIAVPAPAHAAMSVDQFVAKHNGGKWDFDGAYGAQCVDLIQFYNRDVVGAPRLSGNAKDLFGNASGTHYHKLGSGTAPVKGDVAVWGASVGGGYGHAGIVLADQGGSVRILSQNNHAPYNGTTPTEIISMSKAGIIGYLRPKNLTPPAPTGHAPVGHFDSVAVAEPGRIAVRGWAFDRDDAARSLAVHVYIGGQAGAPGVEGHEIRADKSRPDVNSTHNISGNHGFDSFINSRKVGSQQVCAYAIGVGNGGNALISCRTITIPDPNPLGKFETAASSVPGTIDVKGWSFDRSKTSTALEMHVYVGGEAGSANVEVHKIRADVARSDVNNAHGISGNHGFDNRLAVKKTGTQKVCVYAINTGVGWNNTSLGCKTVSIEAAAAPGLGAGSLGS
ncbi:CHAP domain-containing protein [Dietzia cercidiphylli]|uniref:Peptidase C51 domain-containing protein n=1 Tax=Dietzia cercidiphylli TaxID=498199 RepID=A0ABP4UH71_9ACTN|nr:CHAP domain-containing protein [Dietzia cercidiphylli]MBB1049386.1 CHAP domain-containing protein [Dietzia cercidiphylli]